MSDSEIEEKTDAHFMTQLNLALGQFSNSNSNSNSNSDDDIESVKFRKLTYADVAHSFDQYNSNSNELDILVTYLNGQKNIYLHSSNYAKNGLNMLMIPVLVLSSSSTLIAPFIMGYKWSGAIISAMNALIILFVSLINYFKLESMYSSFLFSANQYDRLHTSLNLANSKYLSAHGDVEQNELIASKIVEFEQKISEVQTSVHIPIAMKLLFPVISHINIFSFIKHVETYKRNLIIRYKDIKNEIRYIRQKGGEGERKKTRYAFLLSSKDKLKDEIIQHKNVYNEIEAIFVKEIKNAETYRWFSFVEPTHNDTNSIIYKHLAL